MLQGVLERSYRRLGPRYLERAVFLQQQLVYVMLIGAIAYLSLYVDMSLGEFLRLSLVGCGFQFLYSLLTIRFVRRASRPITAWLEGTRTDEATIAAWRTAASLPWELLRGGLIGRPLGPALWSFFLIASLYLAWELELPLSSGLLVYLAAVLVVSYGAALRFFGVERIVRPVLEDIGPALPAGGPPGIRGLSLLLSNSITEPIAELREATRRVGAGDFGGRVAVVTSDETGELGRSFNEMAAGLAERERIREAFGTYVDREVAEHILQEGTDLAGEEVEVTMMFIDIRDFTGFAERSSAPEVVATLNRLFERIVPAIHEHGGHVDKFVGDGLLAVFGAPRRQEDHADEALAAAQEMERAVREQFSGELEIGIGLNSGTVVAGNVGGAGRLEFSVIGDAVNVAARVEAATRETGDVILVAEDVQQLLRNAPPLEARPGVALKGKRQSVTLYAPSATPKREGEEQT